ncbi:MAG: FAD-dependent oxidoreductase, partial [Gaiella sp.]
MSFPASARAVVVGCGIVGNSLAFHLTRLGWSDVLLIDKGPLPNPGGSTGHASNFIFLVDHSKEMTQLTVDSARQYRELGVYTECGGIEVARTEERMEELRRRMASAKSWGIEPVSLVTPAQIKELVPFIDESILLGGFYTPGVGVVDSLRAGTMMRESAAESGALSVFANTHVSGMDVEHGRIRRVHTSRGTVEAEVVVVACGVWSPILARMAGAHIPLVPMVHQMIDVGPVPRFEKCTRAIEFPIVRDMDVFMYERQDGIGLEIGSYAHRSIQHDPEEIPSIEEAALSPTEFPFTQADFDPQMQDALDLMPEIVGDESVGVKYAINGLISLTPDGMPLLGETPEVKGLWSAAAVWVKEGPGVGKSLAEWMAHGESHIDLHTSDISRFHAHQKTRSHVRARTFEAFPKTYGIVHPAEQWSSDRNLRLSPMHEREQELGAVFYEAAGWERPQWYEANAPLVAKYGVDGREAEWDARWWSPIINAEHLAMREHAGIFDLSAFAIFDVTGAGALPMLQRACLAQMDVPVGRVVYTPVLGQGGGFKSDLTVMRLADETFRIVTGGAHGMADRKWFSDLLPADGSAGLVDVTTAWTTIGLWGPRARDILSSVTRDDVSNEGFPFGRCRELEIGSQLVLASRISYVGDLGWELYVPIEQGARLWDTLWEAGLPHSLTACGIGVYGTTGRLEKSYRAYGAELETEYDVVEAGMQRPKVKDEDFVGK